MGTFLVEYVDEEAFDNVDKVKMIQQLLWIFHELGEVGIETVSMVGETCHLINPDRLNQDEKVYEIFFNFYEGYGWEPSYMRKDLEKFIGVVQSGIWSKVGRGEHYKAMAAAKVFCECMGNGHYYVAGDIGNYGVFKVLGWIRHYFGEEYVINCLNNRMNYQAIWQACNNDLNRFDDIAWGYKSNVFFEFVFLKTKREEWFDYISNISKKDLSLITEGKDPIYVHTYFYLFTLFLFTMIEKEFREFDIMRNMESKIITVFEKYRYQIDYQNFEFNEEILYGDYIRKLLLEGSDDYISWIYVFENSKVLVKVISEVTGVTIDAINTIIVKEHSDAFVEEDLSILRKYGELTEQKDFFKEKLAKIAELDVTTEEYLGITEAESLFYYGKSSAKTITPEMNHRIHNIVSDIDNENAEVEILDRLSQREYIEELMTLCTRLEDKWSFILKSTTFYDFMFNRCSINSKKICYLKGLLDRDEDVDSEELDIILAVICNDVLGKDNE